MEEMFKQLEEWGWDWIQFKCSGEKYSIMIGMKKWFTSHLSLARELPAGHGTSFEEAWTDLLISYGEQAEVL